MKVNLMVFVGKDDIRMEKEYDLNKIKFVPRKGDLIEDKAFGYSSPMVVNEVSINYVHEYCTVYLSQHELLIESEEHIEEVVQDYIENNWLRT